ncbi:MAG: penicillin-binding transpeptidase domain-containing protein [Chitinophagaceae bacterium]
MSTAAGSRQLVLRAIFIGMGLVLLIRLLFLQLFEPKYKIMANDIAIYRQVVYPPRGVIYDRNGKVLCYNEVVYDLQMTSNNVPRDFDSSKLCQVLGIDGNTYYNLHERAKWANGPMRPGTFLEQLSTAQAARFGENKYSFPGFDMVERNIRSYPEPIGGAFLGFIGEISPRLLKKDRFSSYQQGDYLGLDGLELSYEEVLRGQRGVYFKEKDNYNRPRDSYLKGALDTPAVAGQALHLYLDEKLQAYGEKLMQNKLGSIVAIDPSTGGILAMVSAPSYDPNLLRGADRSKNFSRLYQLHTKPLFNRAIKASYSPGSTQKPYTALIALDDGAITPAFGYPCRGAYYACGRPVRCTETWAGHAANLRLAIANSCNSYFCHIYRLSVDEDKFGGVKKGLEDWYRHMFLFGFGHPTGVDIPYEIGGTLFDSTDYNKLYNGSWNSCTNLFLGMGQGELSVTPMQMANSLCIVANHGFFYVPHFVKSIGNNPKDPSLARFLVKHEVTNIPDTMYKTVTLGMMDVVNAGTGRVARLPGIEVCGKTGTVENYAFINGKRTKLQNHSMFVAFAPRGHPKIAIAVTVENAGYGATWAGPIASLMMEKYLTDTIAKNRLPLQERILKGNVINMRQVTLIDSARRAADQARYERRLQNAAVSDSVKRAYDSLVILRYIKTYLLPKK